MKRTLILSTVGSIALTGMLTLGSAGSASAATTGTPAATPTATSNHTANCTKAEARVPKIEAREAKLPAWEAKAQAAEAKAKSAGHTKVAALVAHRISRVEKLAARGNKVIARIGAVCGTSSTTS
jgi:hypothetical protein